MSKICIVAAHADDESLGMGGTLYKLHDSGNEIHLLILTGVWAPKWSDDQIAKRERDISRLADTGLFSTITRWDFKDNMLDTYPKNELQEKLIEFFDNLKPQIVYTPGYWDNNFEHRLAYELVMIASKPLYSSYLKQIIAYEVPSLTDLSNVFEHTFNPNLFIPIEEYMEKKKSLCALYETEMKQFPHPRSPEYLEILAKKRGVECGKKYAEAFFLVREIRDL